MSIRVEAAAASSWEDVVQAFGAGASRATSCWCQRFRRHEEKSNRDALQREMLESVVPVGLVAYLDDVPVGWSRVVPRRTLPGILENRALQRLLEPDDSAWWVSCVNIRREARGQGVGTALLEAATGHARDHSASVLDGHPVDVGLATSRPSPSALFTGTVSMFTAAGFVELGRTYPTRPVMRVDLT